MTDTAKTGVSLRESGVFTINNTVVVCLAGLLLVLPIAHTASIRAFLLLFPAVLWAGRQAVNRRLEVERTPLDIPLLLYFITVILSLFTSLKLSMSVDEVRKEFLTYALLFYMTASVVRRESEMASLIRVLLIGSLFMALYGIAEFFIKGGSVLSLDFRADSLHQGFEAYGQYIITVAPFAIVALFHSRTFRERVFLSALLALNVFALFLTHTRGAWVAFWVELLLLSALLFRNIVLRWSLILALIIVPILSLKVLPEYVLWHGSAGIDLATYSRRLNTVSDRLITWRNSVKGIAREPFRAAGYGRTNFKRRFPGGEFRGFDQAHNTFINTATQLGVQGLAALLFIIFVVIRAEWRLYRNGATEFARGLGLSSLVMTIGFFTANQFAEFYIDDTALMFWLLTALSISALRLNKAPGNG